MGTSSRRRAPRCLLPIRGSTPNPGDDGRRVSYDSDSLDSVPCRVLDSAAWSRFDADDSRADRSFAGKSASPRSQLPRSRRSRDSDPSAERKAWIADSASDTGTYRWPQRFLRDTAPPLTKPAPLRLGTFSREWAQSRRETLAERRRLLWERVKDARNGVPPRREVFQPASVRDKSNSESEVSEP